MHTTPDTPSPAAEAAALEAKTWIELSNDWSAAAHFYIWDDIPGSELAVVGLHDPSSDLHRRMNSWAYAPGSLDLADLTRFASGLAQAESDAWTNDHPHVATKAYADRRFLLGDRIMHWAVPWLDAIERAYPDRAVLAANAKQTLLELGDVMRPAPALSGSEGLVVPGFDGFGPLLTERPACEMLLSVWSGSVLTRPDLAQARHTQVDRRHIEVEWLADGDMRHALTLHYQQAAIGWESVAVAHPGSAQLWLDLSARAATTAGTLAN